MQIGILGGGIAGKTAAIGLSSQHEVTLLSQIGFDQSICGETTHEDLIPLLRKVGVDTVDLVDCRHTANKLVIWGHRNQRQDTITFLNRSALEQRLSWVVRDRGIAVKLVNRIESIKHENDQWEVESFLAEGTSKEKFDFLIDATGRHSLSSLATKIKRTYYDKSVAIMGRFRHDHLESSARFILESFPNGWGYMAQQSDKEAVVAYVTDGDLIKGFRGKRIADFLHLLPTNSYLAKSLRDHQMIKYYGPIDNRTSMLTQVAGEKWIAIGDACIKEDCLSGSGILNAVRSSLRASELISKSVSGRLSSEEIELYQSSNQNQLSLFISQQKEYYLLERRWKENPFWKRRSNYSFSELNLNIHEVD